MAIASMDNLIVEQLRDLYDAERRLTRAFPKLAKEAMNEELQAALEAQLSETEAQIERLDRCFRLAGVAARGKTCKGIQGIIEEGDEHISEEYEDDSLRDAVIIATAQKAEHYKMAAYGTVIAHATSLGRTNLVELLEQSLEEEKAADQTLSAIGVTMVNLDAAAAGERDSDEDETDLAGHGRHESRRSNGGRSNGSSARSRTRVVAHG